jgi:DNA-binding transcriptional LysR family regulator
MNGGTWRADGLGVQQIRAFLAVHDRGSYAAAARALGRSVPAVWEQVRAVERVYGADLFEREGRVIRATPAAGLLHGLLSPLLAGLDSTVEALREQAGRGPGTLSIVTGVRMVLEDLGGALRRFQKRHPETALRLLHRDPAATERAILDEEADLALLLDPEPGRLGPQGVLEPAYELDLLAVMRRGDPLARRRALRLRDLAEATILAGHPGTHGRQLLDAALHREGIRVRMAVETDNSAAVLACVRAGMGVGIVAGRPDGFLARGLVTRRLRAELGPARIMFLRKKGRRAPRALETLMRLIREDRAIPVRAEGRR